MSNRNTKQEVVTFKADAALVEAMRDVENRSEFIRAAVLAALQNVCPLCMGTGILTPSQRRHWERFSRDHAVERCDQCNERHLTCSHGEEEDIHGGAGKDTPAG